MEALIGSSSSGKTQGQNRAEIGDEQGALLMIPVEIIEPNPFQARKNFDEVAIAELASSIRENGILQPLVVMKDKSGGYCLIAGERRLRAAKEAGLKQVPAHLVKPKDDKTAAILGLVENLQREDLDPIEEAKGFALLGEKFGLTQEATANSVSKSRPYVANAMRLLELPPEVVDLIRDGLLSAGHGRAVLRLPTRGERVRFAQLLVDKKMSVREAEAMAQKLLGENEAGPGAGKKTKKHPHQWISDDLKVRFGTKVDLAGGSEKGRIIIHYFSESDLTRIIDILKS